MFFNNNKRSLLSNKINYVQEPHCETVIKFHISSFAKNHLYHIVQDHLFFLFYFFQNRLVGDIYLSMALIEKKFESN